jgi:hypothetical protein
LQAGLVNVTVIWLPRWALKDCSKVPVRLMFTGAGAGDPAARTSRLSLVPAAATLNVTWRVQTFKPIGVLKPRAADVAACSDLTESSSASCSEMAFGSTATVGAQPATRTMVDAEKSSAARVNDQPPRGMPC